MNYWFTADLHLYHKNIIRYTNRPVLKPSDLNNEGEWANDYIAAQRNEEMAEIILKNWNDRVSNKDIVYLLGDFCFGNEKVIAQCFRRLNGNIKVIFGNHDKTLKKFAKKDLNAYSDLRNRIEFLGDYAKIEINNQKIVLSHYSFRVWDESHRGSWNLWGHSHGSLVDDPHSLGIDVGIDCHNYAPISFDEVKQIMSKKLWVPIDHHGQPREGGGIGLNKEDYARLERKRQYQQLRREFET